MTKIKYGRLWLSEKGKILIKNLQAQVRLESKQRKSCWPCPKCGRIGDHFQTCLLGI